jgi:site-specific recombinase XerD
MTRAELSRQIEQCLCRLEKDGHSKEVIDTNRWITDHFAQYCEENQHDEITFELITEFLRRQYAIYPFERLCAVQLSVRRPLLILWEYSQTGNYLKSHLHEQTKVPSVYSKLYLDFCDHINALALNVKTKSAKARFAKSFLSYLEQNGISDISGVSHENISQYINSKTDMAFTTKQTIAYNLREMLNWLSSTGAISFSGFEAFPKIRYPGRKFISSCYSNDEIRKILDCVDTGTVVGKHNYLVLSLLIYYGMRIGDILALRFENIDQSVNAIRITQQKTRKPLTLPLIDEVKYPLLDYLKNARPDVDDPHILITLCAPHTAYAKNQSLQRVVVKYMDKAGVDYSNRHHGTHAMRYSLAGNLLNENVPISAISGVLGHGSITTTDLYLELDETGLGKLALEVPDVSNA